MQGSQRTQRREDRSERVEKIFDRKFLKRMRIINRRSTIGVVRVSDRNSVSKFELMNEVMREKFISTRVSKMQTQRVRESKVNTKCCVSLRSNRALENYHRRCEDRNERSDVRIAASGWRKVSLRNFS